MIVEFAIIEVTIEVDHGDQNFIVWRFSDASVPEGSANTYQTEPMRMVADLPGHGITLKPIIMRTEPSSPRVPFGSAVVFDASGSYHEGGEPLSFVWESDIDGVIGRSSSFSTHMSKGVHTITLKVTADVSGHHPDIPGFGGGQRGGDDAVLHPLGADRPDAHRCLRGVGAAHAAWAQAEVGEPPQPFSSSLFR
jgi:hypothetical protein